MKFKEFFNLDELPIDELLLPGMLLTDGSEFARILFIDDDSIIVNQYRYTYDGEVLRSARNNYIWFDKLIESNFVPDLEDLPTRAIVNSIVFGELDERDQ